MSVVWRSGVSEVYSCLLFLLFVYVFIYECDYGWCLYVNKGNIL